jgi:hypothetical protein
MTRYVLDIENRERFDNAPKSIIRNLKPRDWGENKLHNLQQYFIYFADATIVINPLQIILEVHDILSESVYEGDLKRLNIAVDYVKKLYKELGIYTSTMRLENSHYAKIEPYFYGALEKINKRYCLTLDDGRKLWIDKSTGEGEVESNHIQMAARMDEWLKDMMNTEALMSDIDKLNKTVGGLVRLEILRAKDKMQLSIPEVHPETKKDPGGMWG